MRKRVRIAITPQTTIVRHDTSAGIADVKVGMRIVVPYYFAGEAPTADTFRLFTSR